MCAFLKYLLGDNGIYYLSKLYPLVTATEVVSYSIRQSSVYKFHISERVGRIYMFRFLILIFIQFSGIP